MLYMSNLLLLKVQIAAVIARCLWLFFKGFSYLYDIL